MDDDVELKYYRLQKISEGSIDLKLGEPEPLYGPTDVGTGQPDEVVKLSTLVSKLNERFGTEFTPADQQLENLLSERMEGNEEIFTRLMNDEEFRSIAANHLMAEVYSLIKPEKEISE